MSLRDVRDARLKAADTWFNSGILSVSEGFDKPLTYVGDNKQQASCDVLDKLSKTSQNGGQDNAKLNFHFKLTIAGKQPRKCIPLNVANNSLEHWSRLSNIQKETVMSQIKSFASRKSVEDVFDIAKDPETLDDSDIDALLEENQRDSNTSESSGKKPKLEMLNTYLIVSLNSIYKVGDALPTIIYGGITDCQVFETYPGNVNSLVLVTLPSGYLLSILMQAGQLGSVVTQYWNLGAEGTWYIVKHTSSEQFVAINKSEGICKFFRFVDPLHFELVNNLTIDGAFILDCTFFPNSSQSHFLLFVPTLRYQRLVYFCIEWDSKTPEMKQVHHLTYLTAETLDKCIPVGHNRCLVFYDSKIDMISANQIMSGEAAFESFEMQPLKGICGHFPAPNLLQKLKLVQGKIFAKYIHCTILATRSGNIIFCVLDDQDDVKFFSLTRFKGLKSVCAVSAQKNIDNEYDIVVVSFGRTLQLSIDITKIIQLEKNSIIPSLNGITFKHTLDSSTEENSELLVISPSKVNSRYSSELWLTSTMALSHLETFSPIRKLHTICKMQQFQICYGFKIFNCRSIGGYLKARFFDEIGRNDKQKYLIVGTDFISMSKVFILDLRHDLSKPQLTEVDDLLHDVAGNTIDVFFTAETMVQITADAICVKALNLDAAIKTQQFIPEWKIEGAAYCNNKVVIWNANMKELWYINNVDGLLDGESFLKSASFGDEMNKNCNGKLEFIVAEVSNEKYVLYMANNENLIRFAWDALAAEHISINHSEILCSGRCSSLVAFDSWVCFLRSDAKVMRVSHSNAYLEDFEMNYGKKDIQLRRVDGDACLIFSAQEITMLSLYDVEPHEWKFYDLKLPYQGKVTPILDVKVDKVDERIFVLYSDGLQVFDMSYFTWNSSNYLLRSTRSLKKRILFIEKINRMLVVNFDTEEWDCIKLVDGKSLSLDTYVLRDVTNNSLVNLAEIPTTDKIVHLILHFHTLIKLVHLIPQKGKITVEEVFRYDFEQELSPNIELEESGAFFLLQNNDTSQEQLSPHAITFWKMKIDSGNQLETVKKLSFPVKEDDFIVDFKICGKDVIVINAAFRRIFVFKDFENTALSKTAQVISLKIPLASEVHKICPLDCESFVTVVSCEGRSDHISELLLYHMDDLVSKTNYTPKQETLTCFQRAIEGEDLDEDQAQETANHSDRRADDAEEDDTSDVNYHDFLSRMIDETMGRNPTWEPDDLDLEYDEEIIEVDGDGDGDEEEEQDQMESSTHEYILNESDEGSNEDDGMDEMDEYDAFERPIPGRAINPDWENLFGQESSTNVSERNEEIYTEDLLRPVHTPSTKKRPYKVIKLDKSVKDIKYDPIAKRLYVLANDSSVIIFQQVTEPIDRTDDRSNSGYHITKERPISHRGAGITEAGLFPIDSTGQI